MNNQQTTQAKITWGIETGEIVRLINLGLFQNEIAKQTNTQIKVVREIYWNHPGVTVAKGTKSRTSSKGVISTEQRRLMCQIIADMPNREPPTKGCKLANEIIALVEAKIKAVYIATFLNTSHRTVRRVCLNHKRSKQEQTS